MRQVTFAVTQMPCDWDVAANVARAEGLVREAASRGAQIILLQELFETPYFCKDQDSRFFDLAHKIQASKLLESFGKLAAELQVVLPISFFERAHNAYFNSVAIIDADGKLLGVYRKSHIPDGPGYQEKFYFSPGDTGFRVWDTQFGRIGVAICWDQWFPEAARAMVLNGAEALLYPTAIGSEPGHPEIESCGHWQRVMQGHAGANCVPVIAANRVGTERGDTCELTFYGSSFICDYTGDKVCESDRESTDVGLAELDLDVIQEARAAWGLFRDRRPDLYGSLLSRSGEARESPP